MDGWIFEHALSPNLAEIGPLTIRWYSLMYLGTFFSGYWYYLRQSRRPDSPVTPDDVSTLLIFGVLGVILGGRVGWVLFYGLQTSTPYLSEPWRILQVWKGGLSFHGGLLGVTLAIVLYSRHIRQPILTLGDFIVPWVPVGVLLVRVGNFINGELYGKPTDGSWGVKFYTDPLCRDATGSFVPQAAQCVPHHPSQLYEAFGEGIVVLILLMWLRRVKRPGIQPAAFMFLYGIARVVVEFVRLPDAEPGYLAWNVLTMGHVLSVPMILAGGVWLIVIFSRPKAITTA